MEKRNYEKYLDGEALEPANPFEMPRFEPGGFEGNQGNTGEFNTLGSIPAAPTPPNPYSNNSDNGYNVPPAGNNYNMNGANFEGLEEPMSMGEWFVCMLIMMVPCVNIVMMFVWAFSKNEKKSKSNFYKVQLIVMGVILALYMILGLIFVGAGVGLASLSMR